MLLSNTVCTRAALETFSEQQLKVATDDARPPLAGPSTTAAAGEQQQQQPAGEPPELKFRNYVPKDEKIDHAKVGGCSQAQLLELHAVHWSCLAHPSHRPGMPCAALPRLPPATHTTGGPSQGAGV